MKKMQFGMQQPKVVKIYKSHTLNKQEKYRGIKLQQKQYNALNKLVSNSPLLVGIASLNQYISPLAVATYFEKQHIQQYTSRQLFFTPLEVQNPYCVDQVFPVNLLLVITTDETQLPEQYDAVHQTLKLQNRLIYWKVPFDDVIRLYLDNNTVVAAYSSKIHDNVLSGSLFDLQALCNLFNSVRGDFRAAWMKPRGVGKIVDAQELQPGVFRLQVLGLGITSDSCFITNCGDFRVVYVNGYATNSDEYHFCAPMGAYPQYQVPTQLPELETPITYSYVAYEEDSDDSALTDMTENGPIEKDYEFKMNQKRDGIYEMLDRPDDLEINPKTQLSQLLQGFAPLDSARNSVFPFGVVPGCDKLALFYVSYPGQIEREILQSVALSAQSDSFETSYLFDVVVAVQADSIAEYSAHMKEAALALIKDENLADMVRQMPVFYRFYFTPALLVNQTLAFLLSNEQKVGLCHATCVRTYGNAVLDLLQYYTVYIGFRRIVTMPIPYTPLSEKRGKLLRIFSSETTQNIAFAFPAQINALHSRPLPVIFFSDGKPAISARTREFYLNYQLLQRLVLTGWPYRIHKRKCICRFMLFNRADVLYFKAAGLSCGGLNGRILQPVGEKGYFKCVFDGYIQCGQVIEMKLYAEEPGLGLGLGIWGMEGCGYEPIFYQIACVYRYWVDRLYEGL